ncbi:MAG: UbiA-like polyprenyltransferase [Trueperaceae bacterium]|nr:UbiA-like polyprenyltransferase [Trueperaceae bacterium]
MSFVQSSDSRKSLKTYLDFVRFEHTLFALPFAYGGMLLAERGWPGFVTFFWITLAMVGARTASMALNRVIDADIDAKNPRTETREIPKGRLSRRDGVVLAVLGFAVLGVSGWALNPLTFALLPVAVFFLALYPYTKRYTWLCHYWLGLTIGAAAAGGWIAVTGSFAPAAVTLWAGVGLWIAGFDILYGVLDYDFDKRHGVYSVPASFGIDTALSMSAATHLLAWGFLALTLPFAQAGWPFALGLAAVAAILYAEHRMIASRSVADVLRSFNANLYVGAIMLIAIIVDVALV